MKVKEAEKQFEADKRAHDRHYEKFAKKIRIAGGVIGSVLSIYGGMCLGTGVLILITVAFLFSFYTSKKYRVYYLATRNLYRNYLCCTDMDDEDKEFYMQKLKELNDGIIQRNIVLYSQTQK